MSKWEYLVIFIQAQQANAAAQEMGAVPHLNADKFTEELNRHATAGWELMQFEWVGEDGARAIFKRPRG